MLVDFIEDEYWQDQVVDGEDIFVDQVVGEVIVVIVLQVGVGIGVIGGSEVYGLFQGLDNGYSVIVIVFDYDGLVISDDSDLRLWYFVVLLIIVKSQW